jgi:hypothetical protein
MPVASGATTIVEPSSATRPATTSVRPVAGGQAKHATDARRAASSPSGSGAGGDTCTAGSGAALRTRLGGDADRSANGRGPA